MNEYLRISKWLAAQLLFVTFYGSGVILSAGI